VHIVVVTTAYPPRSRQTAEPSYAAVAKECVRRGHAVTALCGRASGSPEREDVDGVDVLRRLGPVTSGADLSVTSVASQCRSLRGALRGRDSVILFAEADGLPPALLGVAPEVPRWIDLCHDWVLTAFAASHPWWVWSAEAGGMARISAKALGAVIERPDARGSGFLSWKRARWEELLSRGVPVAAARVLRPGIDTAVFGFQPREIGGDTVRLQYQGPLRRDGGLNAVFLALNGLPERVRLRIVAESTEASYLAELAEVGRAAGVTGRVEVVPAANEAQRLPLLRSADVFVQSSESGQAFPRYALEAAAAGIPVVAARPESGEDISPWRGKSALRFPAGNPRALTECLESCLKSPELVTQMTRAARRMVEESLGVVYSADQLESLLDAP
jgi:glycosyltransferase involved in cell wall biosynthesis